MAPTGVSLVPVWARELVAGGFQGDGEAGPVRVGAGLGLDSIHHGTTTSIANTLDMGGRRLTSRP